MIFSHFLRFFLHFFSPRFRLDSLGLKGNVSPPPSEKSRPEEGETMGKEVDKENSVLTPPILAVTAPASKTGRVIAALGPLLLQGRALYCLDGGNVFDPYRLALWMRAQGFDPAPALERIFVSRAYTCHQLVGAVEAMLSPLVEQEPTPVVALLGVDKLFHDEDLPLHERRYLFDRIVACAGDLGRRGLPFLITLTPVKANPWARRLARVTPILPDVEKLVDAVSEPDWMRKLTFKRSQEIRGLCGPCPKA